MCIHLNRARHDKNHTTTAAQHGSALCSHGTLAMKTHWWITMDTRSAPVLQGGRCEWPNSKTRRLLTRAASFSKWLPSAKFLHATDNTTCTNNTFHSGPAWCLTTRDRRDVKEQSECGRVRRTCSDMRKHCSRRRVTKPCEIGATLT